MIRFHQILILCAAILLLAALACGPLTSSAPLPTLLPTAVLTTSTGPAGPASSPLPPTRDLATDTPEPTLPLPTRRPTATPDPGQVVVNLTSPAENGRLVLGTTIVASGLAQLNAPDQSILVQLVTLDGRLLAEAAAVDNDNGSWQASLAVPVYVGGVARLLAFVRDGGGETLAADGTTVNLTLDSTAVDRYLALSHPLAGQTAVAGYYLYFDGQTALPNGLVTIALLADECQTMVARQSFSLRSGGYWQGYLVVPRDLEGPACAVAYTSTRGDETSREVQLPVDVILASDDAARGLQITAPAPGGSYTAGQNVTLTGIVYNAPRDEILLSVVLEDGRLITQQTVTVQSWGYWEAVVRLPVDVSGPAQVSATAGAPGDDHYSTASQLFQIQPAPP